MENYWEWGSYAHPEEMKWDVKLVLIMVLALIIVVQDAAAYCVKGKGRKK